jgi:hypothetical protein
MDIISNFVCIIIQNLAVSNNVENGETASQRSGCRNSRQNAKRLTVYLQSKMTFKITKTTLNSGGTLPL